MKLLLGCGCLLVLCACACVAAFVGGPLMLASAFNTDSAKARQTGAQIADYILPAGYSEQFSLDLSVVKMVVIGPAGNSDAFYVMMQAPGVGRDQIEAQMRQIMQQQNRNTGDVQYRQVGTQAVTIKGKPATMTIFEGTNSDSGELIRQGIVSFDGKGGTVVLMVVSPANAWNEAQINQFLASIR
jgi:hypothetical protein